MKIAMYAGSLRYWGKLNPRALFEDVPSPAGTEIALMGVARALAARGHQVQVFAECEPGTYDRVEYLRADLALPLLSSVEYDVVVSWQDAALFLYPLKAKLRVLMSQSAHLAMGQVADSIDRTFGISRFSGALLLTNEPYADPSKMWLTRNGVFLDRFARETADGHTRTQMVWASSADRGLHHLLPVFRRVKQEVPEATLTVCYDFDRLYASYKESQPGGVFLRHLEQARALKREPGVEFLQHVSQPRMANLLMHAGVFTYLCDPVRPTETYCNAINEAMAAGLPVVTTDADCLPENYGSLVSLIYKRPLDYQEIARGIIELMTDDKFWRLQRQRSLDLAAMTDYREVAAEWETLFSQYFAGVERETDFSLAARKERGAL